MTSAPTELRVWFGVLAAPLAWVAQHVSGYAVSEAACDPVGRGGIAQGTIAGVTSAGALAVALAGLVVADRVRRATSADAPPPESRRHFLGVVGMAIAPLFMCIIVMSGVGAVVLESCRQS